MKQFQPYPQYKESGLPWLGAIPSSWDVISVKRGYEVQLGKMLQPEPLSDRDSLEYYLRAANIFWSGVDYSELNQMWMSPEEKGKYRVKSGDLLVSEGGDVGRSSLVQEEPETEVYFQNALNRVRPKRRYSNKFLYYWLYGLKESGYIDIICGKATISHLTAERLKNIELVAPSLEEQQKIARFLGCQTAKIDNIIIKLGGKPGAEGWPKGTLLGLLEEYKRALISEAVTGKIDVRDWEPPETEPEDSYTAEALNG